MTGESQSGASGWASGLGDEQLLAELARVMDAAEPVPARVVAAGKAAWTWRTVDAELAELAHDSGLLDQRAVTVRGSSALEGPDAQQAVLRWMTFASDNLSIELEVTSDAVLGQLVPPRSATVELELLEVPKGTAGARIPVDDLGWFQVSPIPAGRFRLRCTVEPGSSVVTGWITL
jgi:hypothetical protein